MSTSGAYFGVAYNFTYAIPQGADPTAFYVGTFAAGEVKVSKRTGSGAISTANIASSPTAGSTGLMNITLSATEMQADEVTVEFIPVSNDFAARAVSIVTSNLLTPSDAGLYNGFRGQGIYIDTNISNTGTTTRVDGTQDNPVSTIAAAKTIADATGYDRFYLVNGSSITLAAAHTNYEFVGVGEDTSNVVNLGGQDVGSSSFYNLQIQGDGSAATSRIYAEGCSLADAPAAATTTLHIFASRCGIVDSIEVDTSNDNVFDQCFSLVAGSGYPTIAATGAAGTIALRHYSGGIGFESLSGSHNVSVEGNGQVVFESSCNVNASVSIRGNFTITDNTAGMISVTDAARWATDQLDTIDANVDAILVDTGTTIPGTIATVDANVDSILVDTGTTLPAQISGVETKVDTVDTNVDAVLVDTGTTLPATLTTIEGKVDTVDTVADSIKTDTAAILTDTGTTLPDQISGVETKVDTVDAVADLIKVDTSAILADTGTDGVVISTAQAQAIADEVLKRSVGNVEGASLSEHSLATIVLAILESSRSNTTWTIKRTDGTTTQVTKTLTLDQNADPVTGVQ